MLFVHFVVAIADHQHHAEPGQATAEELDQVERRLVGPVGVLDDHHRRRRQTREMVEDRVEDVVPAGRRADRPGEVSADLPRNVVQRRQGMGREQRLAAAPQHAGGLGLGGGKLPKQRCLANAGLAGNQGHSAAIAWDAIEQGAQLLDGRLTLKQLHSRPPGLWRKEFKGFRDEGELFGSERDPYSYPIVPDEPRWIVEWRGPRRGRC